MSEIDITGVNLRKLVQEVYAASSPQGLGLLHYQKGGLSDEDADAIVAMGADDKHIVVRMDYVKGRSCKMTVWRRGERLVINDRWFDHTPDQLRSVLDACGIGVNA